MTAPAWRPLLDGELAARAREAVDAIAADLAALPTTPTPGQTFHAHGLTGGSAGWALFHAYRGQATPDLGDDERAMELVALALEAIVAGGMDASLYHGFTGVAWTVEHLGRHFYDLGGEDPLAPIDAHLVSRVAATAREDGAELMRGLIGHGVYALERLPRPGARALLAAVIGALEASATSSAAGLAWFTPFEHQGVDAEDFPTGCYNLGLAHGVCAALPFLARCVAAEVEATRARRLLDGVTAWMLAQRRDEADGKGLFPAFVAAERVVMPMRSGWCYGDLGAAAALAIAGRLVDEPSWRALAVETARAAARRPPADLKLADAALCHGACGAGHIYNRLYQWCGDAAFAEAARGWFERGLAKRTPGRGIGGFQEHDPTAPDEALDSPGFLGGAAGIGLALLGALHAHVPAWDAVLLLGAP